MKKYIFALAALVCGLFTGCTNDEIEADLNEVYSDQLTLNITTESMYDELGLTNSIKEQALRDGDFEIMVYTFLYDSEGLLVDEDVSYAANTNPVTVRFQSVKYGTYTVVAVETLGAKDNGRKPYDWQISGKANLSTLQIDRVEADVYWYAALGSVTKSITMKGSRTESIAPKALGNTIQSYFFNFLGSPYLRVCVGTEENISAYRLNPNLSDKERVVKDLSQSGYFTLLGSANVEENREGITLYTLAESLIVKPGWQTQNNVNSTNWYLGSEIPLDMSNGNRFYLGFYLTNNEQSYYSTVANNITDINNWYNERVNNDKEVVDTFTDPYLTWTSTVTQVQNYMSNNLKDYTMYRGDTGKAEAQDLNGDGVDDTYSLIYGSSDALIGQINYYFTSQTSDLYETYAYIVYEAMSFAEIKEIIASRYDYLGEAEDGSYAYYISGDGVTVVYVWDLESYAVVDYESYDHLVNSSSAKGVLSTDAFVNHASDVFKADKLKKIVK